MPGFGCAPRKLLEQPGARALALDLVGDRERHLGRERVAEPCVLGERDDAVHTVVVGVHPDERASVDPVGLDEMVGKRGVDMAHPVEAEIAAVLGESLEERDEGACVAARGRPQPQRRAVPEDDVHRDGRR